MCALFSYIHMLKEVVCTFTRLPSCFAASLPSSGCISMDKYSKYKSLEQLLAFRTLVGHKSGYADASKRAKSRFDDNE